MDNSRIKDVRKKLGLSQTEFGEKIGISKGQISKIESGLSSITNRTIMQICDAFEVNSDWLQTGNGAMFEEPSDLYELIGYSLESLSEVEERLLKNFLLMDSEERKLGLAFLEKLLIKK